MAYVISSLVVEYCNWQLDHEPEQIVNEAQPSWLSLVENEDE